MAKRGLAKSEAGSGKGGHGKGGHGGSGGYGKGGTTVEIPTEKAPSTTSITPTPSEAYPPGMGGKGGTVQMMGKGYGNGGYGGGVKVR